MDLMLANRRCLVTGASAGIGRCIVETLAREGAKVVATARRGDKLKELADSLEKAGTARPAIVVGDVTKADDVKRIAREAAAAIGPIEILVNCAGGSRPVAVESGDAAWDEAYALNFTAGRRMAGEIIPGLRQAKWGRIINITGVMEPRSLPGFGALSAGLAAKASFHIWAKGMSRDLAAEGITVNSVAPGRIDSEQIQRQYPPEIRQAYIDRHIPAGAFGKPADIANVVTFLASPLASYITGTVIPVDGGMSFFGA